MSVYDAATKKRETHGPPRAHTHTHTDMTQEEDDVHAAAAILQSIQPRHDDNHDKSPLRIVSWDQIGVSIFASDVIWVFRLHKADKFPCVAVIIEADLKRLGCGMRWHQAPMRMLDDVRMVFIHAASHDILWDSGYHRMNVASLKKKNPLCIGFCVNTFTSSLDALSSLIVHDK